MKTKYLIILFTIILTIIFLLNKSYALDEEVFENTNKELNISLKNINNPSEVYNFIDLIDDSLLPTATYNMSNKLNDNYDFLTIFAINFILNNEEYYKDSIIIKDNYTYTINNNTYTTNKYIDINKIYDITYNILGKNNYYILNDYLKIEDDIVPLLLIDEYPFIMEIEEISDVVYFSNNYEISVKYKNINLTYKYILEKLDNQYIINNILVV